MKPDEKKIFKLFSEADALTDAFLKAHKPKQRAAKAAAAEKRCRRALELCRADIAAGEQQPLFADGVYRLSALLVRQERLEEAEPLLEEFYNCRAQYMDRLYTGACLAFYGTILCERGAYTPAALVFDEMMSIYSGDDGSRETADRYAACRAYGNAAIAFTYSDTEEGFHKEQFSEPADRLMELKRVGVSVDPNDLKKAAYFAASQQLFETCFGSVSNGDVGEVVKYASWCINACKEQDEQDFYLPAAIRLLALAAARDCRFGDCVKMCHETLDICSSYKDGLGQSPFGSIQSIAADMNLLLGIMHYRASKFDECIRYFEAALAALGADAQGRALREVGYVEAETMLVAMTSAEKAAFAHKYLGLARFGATGGEETDRLVECVSSMRLGAELMETVNPDEPYFSLAASSDYHIIAQMCSRCGDEAGAQRFERLSSERGRDAILRLEKCMGDEQAYNEYMERLRLHKRLALRLGLLELYGDYTRFEIMFSEPPYAEPNHVQLACLNFLMGEYCRVVGKNESAIEYYHAVRKHTFDDGGNTYYDTNEYDFANISSVSCAACLVKLGQMSKARRSFADFVEAQRASNNGQLSQKQLVSIANTSRDIGLNPAACAEYYHQAALAFTNGEQELLNAAELFNQEGICWYNTSPETDAPEDWDINDDAREEAAARLTADFAARELEAFECAFNALTQCDPHHAKSVDLMPSLYSNIGECHMRAGRLDTALVHYQQAAQAFETLFATDAFNQKSKSDQSPYVFQYGLCFKTLGEIYDQREDNEHCEEVLTKAIAIFERLDSDVAHNELAACLNARGCIRYRLGRYRANIEDVTRALQVKGSERGSEINRAIMLKNRSDAYRELGDYKAMQSDLKQSIGLLDQSGMPRELLSSFYGSHWFSMGVCQEGLNRNGKAADAYNKAAKYLDVSGRSDGEDDNAYLKVLCHFRRAVCLCRREEQEYYGALYEYNNAISLLEGMPSSKEKNENLRQLLSSRGSLYEAFREIDLAKADFRRAESLKNAFEGSEHS